MGKKIDVGNGKYLDEDTGEYVDVHGRPFTTPVVRSTPNIQTPPPRPIEQYRSTIPSIPIPQRRQSTGRFFRTFGIIFSGIGTFLFAIVFYFPQILGVLFIIIGIITIITVQGVDLLNSIFIGGFSIFIGIIIFKSGWIGLLIGGGIIGLLFACSSC